MVPCPLHNAPVPRGLLLTFATPVVAAATATNKHGTPATAVVAGTVFVFLAATLVMFFLLLPRVCFCPCYTVVYIGASADYAAALHTINGIATAGAAGAGCFRS